MSFEEMKFCSKCGHAIHRCQCQEVQPARGSRPITEAICKGCGTAEDVDSEVGVCMACFRAGESLVYAAGPH